MESIEWIARMTDANIKVILVTIIWMYVCVQNTFRKSVKY